jgi:hypothetical protein
MNRDQGIDTDVMRTMRAGRPSAFRRPSDSPGAFRSPQDQPEVDRRVAIYAAQVAQTGRITWLPKKKDGD